MNLRKAHRSSVNQTPESNIVYIRILVPLTLFDALYEDGLGYKITINIIRSFHKNKNRFTLQSALMKRYFFIIY